MPTKNIITEAVSEKLTILFAAMILRKSDTLLSCRYLQLYKKWWKNCRKRQPVILVVKQSKYLQTIIIIINQLIISISQINIRNVLWYLLKTLYFAIIFGFFWVLLMDFLYVLLRPYEDGSGYKLIAEAIPLIYTSDFILLDQYYKSLETFVRNQNVRNKVYNLIDDSFPYICILIVFRGLNVLLLAAFKILLLYIQHVHFSILQFANLK